MKLSTAIVLILLVGVPQVLLAEEKHFTPQQKLGWRLFEQSCGVCHTRPTLVSGLYGPELSRESMGGREDIMQIVISNGTPRMPGFKHHFEPPQIDAIVAYLKTIPAPAP